MANNRTETMSTPIQRVRAYALARHIKQVNDLISETSSDYMIGTAIKSYEAGGHTQNQPDTLELITLTTCRKLQEGLARSLKKKIDSINVELLVAKAEKLAMVMQQHKIDYQSALTIITELENPETTAKKADTQTDKLVTGSESLRLFRQAARQKLSVYQLDAIEQLSEFGLNEYIMLNWKPHEREEYFSYSHSQALSLLLAKEHMNPVAAVQEISQLSTLQVNALIKLYDKGLRGEHLRQWQLETRLHFSEENLEKLLRSSLYEKRDPVTALKEITGSKPMAIPVRYT